jgi:glycosyltransferase-like protein
VSALRIALLTYSTKPRGGVVHTLALAEALARAGHDVTVWSLGRGGDAAFFRPVDPAVTVRLVPFPDVPGEDVGDRILRSIAVLGAAFADARERYDVVHAQDCISANAVPGCLRTVHHLDTFTTPALVACHDRAVAQPRALICVSAAVAAEVERGWGRRPTVIPNGVDAARFAAAAEPAGAPGRARWRARLGRYVLAVGGIEPRKGTLDLVEAMALVQAARPDLALVVAGGETLFDHRHYRARVEARALELGVVPTVLGPVPHADLPALVAAADVFAFPSTKEGFGLAAMEALAAGVPLVVRDLPVLREVFGGAAAFADDPPGLAAQLCRAAAGTDPARQAAGTALAARHSWDDAAAAHLDVYRRLTPHSRLSLS